MQSSRWQKPFGMNLNRKTFTTLRSLRSLARCVRPTIFPSSRVHLRAFRAHLGDILAVLEASWAHLGVILGILGASWCVLAAQKSLKIDPNTSQDRSKTPPKTRSNIDLNLRWFKTRKTWKTSIQERKKNLSLARNGKRVKKKNVRNVL